MAHPFSLLPQLATCVGDFNEGLALGDVNGDGKTDIDGNCWLDLALPGKKRHVHPLERRPA